MQTFQLAWITDPHLDLAEKQAAALLARETAALQPGGIVITGDIATAQDVVDCVRLFARDLRLAGCAAPLFLVLGNHDFYGGSVGDVRFRLQGLCVGDPSIGRYLSHAEEPVLLAPGVALVGHDGWADGRAGNYANSPGVFVDHPLVQRALREITGGRRDEAVLASLERQLGSQVVKLGDFRRIQDFAGLDVDHRLAAMQALAAVSAHHVEHLGTRALETAQLLIVATHVPPFPEAAAWPGGLSDARHQPHAVSVHMGETLLRLADAHPTREILVLTGHTHGAGDYAPRPNLRVLTGASDYGRPRPQGVLQLSSMGATLRPIEAPAP